MKSVLIIDDAEDILDFATLSFEMNAWDCHTAQTGADGMRLAAELKPGVILLDYDLDGETGLDVLARLQQRPDTAAIPVIFLTGSDERQRYLDAGAIGLIGKPFDPMKLADRVTETLQNLGYKL